MLLLAAVLLAAVAFRARNIALSLPYCRHVDEKTWIQIAWQMLRDRDPDPGRFTKPSLPVYVLAVGSELGVLRARFRGDAESVADLGKRAYPYYRVPSAVAVTKWLYTSFSVGALLFLGLVAARVGKSDVLLWLAPGLAQLSLSYFRLSWEYMNVDTIGCFFIWATVLHVLCWHERALVPGYAGSPRATRDLVIAAVLAGATVGSKYNLFPIALPIALELWFQGRRRFIARGMVFSVVMIATFLATTPYALVDRALFFREVMGEVHHYATGHGNLTTRAGFGSLARYGADLADDWQLLLPFGLLGLVLLARERPRECALVFSFPVTFLAYMSAQRVVIERNVMSLHLFIALAVAFGALRLAELLERALARLPAPRARRALAVGASALLFVAAVPWKRVVYAYRSDLESRRLAVDWVVRHVEPRTRVFVERSLQMDTSELEQSYRVRVVKRAAEHAARASAERPIVIQPLERPHAHREPGELARFGTRTERLALLGDPRLVIVRP